MRWEGDEEFERLYQAGELTGQVQQLTEENFELAYAGSGLHGRNG
jgi:hypothetical protein